MTEPSVVMCAGPGQAAAAGPDSSHGQELQMSVFRKLLLAGPGGACSAEPLPGPGGA